MSISPYRVRTRFGHLSVVDSMGPGLPIVLLHGNSSSRKVFERQLRAPLGRYYRLIAIDLPGHGASEDAPDPDRAYTLPGYAAAVREVLEQLGVERAAVFGWSLGGHIAYELAASWPGVAGVVTSGAPPLSLDPADLQNAFQPNPSLPLLFSEHLGEAEAQALAGEIAGDDQPGFFLDDLRRTDGRARRVLLESVVAGNAADERRFVAETAVPVALIEGSADRLVNAEYLAGVRFSSLWDGSVQTIEGAGHLAVWQQSAAVNGLLHRFMRHLGKMETASSRRAARPSPDTVPVARTA